MSELGLSEREVFSLLKLVSDNSDYKWHMDTTFLNYMYHEKEYSMKDIGDLLGISWSTVQQQMRKKGISTRSGNHFTERHRKKLADSREGITPWNKGLAGSYEKWTKYGEEAARYRGGTRTTDRGYIKVLSHDHPYKDSSGYVAEHRLIYEQYLGRYLTPSEVVHHRDENTSNNDLSNLFLFPNNSTHMSFHRFKECHEPDITEEEYMVRFGDYLNRSESEDEEVVKV